MRVHKGKANEKSLSLSDGNLIKGGEASPLQWVHVFWGEQSWPKPLTPENNPGKIRKLVGKKRWKGKRETFCKEQKGKDPSKRTENHRKNVGRVVERGGE